jgi:hypothetical protein
MPCISFFDWLAVIGSRYSSLSQASVLKTAFRLRGFLAVELPKSWHLD